MDIKEIDRVVAHLVKELGQAKSHIKELEEEGKRITSFLGKPMEYWIELDVYAKENMYEEMILKICNLEAHIKEIEEIKLEEVEQERERLSKLLVELYKLVEEKGERERLSKLLVELYKKF